MSKIKLTSKEAYLAMFTFLDKHYELTKSDDIGALLGSMALLQDGCPVDSAIQSDWESAIDTVIEGAADANFKLIS